MSIASLATGSKVVLYNVSWTTFDALSRESSGGRMTYDRGTLEIMSPSYHHEIVKRIIGRMVEIYTMERGLPLAMSSSTTLKLRELECGIESDESYYIAAAPRVLGNTEIELPHDPPPDLVVEVDITRSSLNKLDICSALGIPELWRFDGKRLEVRVLRDNAHYEICSQSSVLPGFPLQYAFELLEQRDSLDANILARRFQEYVRQNQGE